MKRRQLLDYHPIFIDFDRLQLFSCNGVGIEDVSLASPPLLRAVTISLPVEQVGASTLIVLVFTFFGLGELIPLVKS